MSESTSSGASTGGIGFVGLLTILFIALKLTNVVHWSWLWVLSPIWISASITLGVLALVGLVFLGYYLFALWRDTRAAKRNAKLRQARAAQK